MGAETFIADGSVFKRQSRGDDGTEFIGRGDIECYQFSCLRRHELPLINLRHPDFLADIIIARKLTLISCVKGWLVCRINV